LAVRSAATDELVGDLGVHFLADDGHQVQIGFTIAPAHQRQGFGTLAVVALLDYLFTVLNKHRVFASVDPRNEASMALLRSVGMRQEAHFRQSLFSKGEWVDDVVLGLLRSEWKNPSTPLRSWAPARHSRIPLLEGIRGEGIARDGRYDNTPR
jgi:RimJ/RimL family protein N-acetyltransferase